MNRYIPEAVRKYLSKRADERWIDNNVEPIYDLVIVIPAIKESENLPKVISSLNNCDNVPSANILVLFVINNSDLSPEDVRIDNEKCINYLLNAGNDQTGKFTLKYIDAASHGRELPPKTAGVGLARKTGMDQALLYLNFNSAINGIVCLDADCTVAPNYIQALVDHFKEYPRSTGVIQYEHELISDAIICYEIFLRYYVLGLSYASSPFGHHSIGSCMVIDPHTYCKIGGMNKKKAGEDFYFLEKAAKVKPVIDIKTTKVFPSSRKSWRVPFGTGQRMTRFHKGERNEYLLYDPHTFEILKQFLTAYYNSNSIELILTQAKELSTALYGFLLEQNLDENLSRILKNSKTEEQIALQKTLWFDGFKTMKLIHYLRDHGFPENEMFSALNQIFSFVDADFDGSHQTSLPSLETQRKYLSKLRQLT